jgi:hypothetical protein
MKEDPTFLRGENLAAMQEIPDHNPGRDAELMQVDDEARRLLIHGFENDDNRVNRYVEALLVALDGTEEDRVSQELLELLCIQYAHAMEVREFSMALKIVERVEREPQLLPTLLKDRTVPVLIPAYVETDDSETRRTIAELLKRCASESSKVLALLATVDDPLDRTALLAIVRGFGEATAEAAREFLGNSSNDYEMALIAMLTDIATPLAMDSLLAALKHPHFDARLAASKSILAGVNPAAQLEACKMVVDDESPILRQLALDYVTERRPVGCREWLRAKLEKDNFHKYELTEKRRFYRAFAAIANAADVDWMLGKLSQDNPRFSPTIDDERVAAAWALAALREQRAVPILEKMTGRWFMVKRRVRKAIKGALALAQSPPDPVKPPPDTNLVQTLKTETLSDSPLVTPPRARRSSAPPQDTGDYLTQDSGEMRSGAYVAVKHTIETAVDSPSGAYRVVKGRVTLSPDPTPPPPTMDAPVMPPRANRESVTPPGGSARSMTQSGATRQMTPPPAAGKQRITISPPTERLKAIVPPAQTQAPTPPPRPAPQPAVKPPPVNRNNAEDDLKKAMSLAKNMGKGKAPQAGGAPPVRGPDENDVTRDALLKAKAMRAKIKPPSGGNGGQTP